MNRKLKYGLLFGVAILFFSCSTQKYIYDNSSLNRQKELKHERSGNVFGDILITSLSAICGTEAEWEPTEQQFKKLNLVNPTTDTVYVNMLTDIYWDKNDYCDFMDIRIPPKEKCKILVPVNANYNVYFSNTPEKDDDEMLEINTNEITQIKLKPSTKLASESQ